MSAEYHAEDIFAIKFYCKKDRRSKYKYSKIINKGDAGNYKYIISKKIGTATFAHFGYPDISGYLLVNRNSGNILEKEQAIMTMVRATYEHLPDLPASS